MHRGVVVFRLTRVVFENLPTALTNVVDRSFQQCHGVPWREKGLATNKQSDQMGSPSIRLRIRGAPKQD
jgi:hypothetical protein